jgi:dephospho-CoA kinase
MLKVGLTGGIGSGKSTVAQLFEVLGIPVYYADEAAKRLMNTDKKLMSAISKAFGEAAYKDGKLDREYISSIVFNDTYKLELLNSIVHPATIKDAKNWMENQSTSYVIKEAAVLFESGAAEHLDYVIGVEAPETIRIKRVMDRDGVSKDEILKRMDNQMDDDNKMKLSDFVIVNDEQKMLIPQVLELHQKLLKLAER